MNNNMVKSKVITVIGLILLVGGLIAIKLMGPDTTIPYLLIGLGCGAFGQGLGEVITYRSEKSHPEIARKREIEESDERNIMLRDRAQAKAYRIMIVVFGALFLTFGLMKVEPKVIVLLVISYLGICGCSIFYSVKYRKEM